MKRVAIILFLAFVCTAGLAAQSVTSFSLDEADLEALLNPVVRSGMNTALIRVEVDRDEVIFSGDIEGPPIRVDGGWDVRISPSAKEMVVKVKGYPALRYDFPMDLRPSAVYLMHISIPDEDRFKALVATVAGFHPSQSSLGLMAGLGRRSGLYLKVKSDFRRTPYTVSHCDEDGMLPDGTRGWFTGDADKSRLAATVGAYTHVKGPVSFYAGAGYGRRILAWKSYDGEFVKVSPYSFAGVEAEFGFMTTFRSMSVITGISSTNLGWVEGDFGIAYVF